jgi:hypothetical protein
MLIFYINKFISCWKVFKISEILYNYNIGGAMGTTTEIALKQKLKRDSV